MLLLLLMVLPLTAGSEPIPGKGYYKRPIELPAGFVAAGINDEGDIVGNHPDDGPILIDAVGNVQILGIAGKVTAINNHRQDSTPPD